MAQTVFDKLGGFTAVSRIVMDFYDQVLDSETIGDFFEHTDMTMQIDHQTKFISSLLGGPASYTDEQLEKIHAHLQITNAHFDEILALLEQSLARNHVDIEDRQMIIGKMESRRNLIVKG